MPYSEIYQGDDSHVVTKFQFAAGFTGTAVTFSVTATGGARHAKQIDRKVQELLNLLHDSELYRVGEGVRTTTTLRAVAADGADVSWTPEVPTDPIDYYPGGGYTAQRWIFNPYEGPIVDLGWFPTIEDAEEAIEDYRSTNPDPGAPAVIDWRVEGPVLEPTP